jgi:hypothetical protein
MTTEAEMRHAAQTGTFLPLHKSPQLADLCVGELMLLLHVASTPGADYRGPGNPDFVSRCMRRLVELDLIKGRDPGEIPTCSDRGMAFVAMILATPLPEQRWVDPRAG